MKSQWAPTTTTFFFMIALRPQTMLATFVLSRPATIGASACCFCFRMETRRHHRNSLKLRSGPIMISTPGLLKPKPRDSFLPKQCSRYLWQSVGRHRRIGMLPWFLNGDWGRGAIRNYLVLRLGFIMVSAQGLLKQNHELLFCQNNFRDVFP